MQRIHLPIILFLQYTLIFLDEVQLSHSAMWLLLSTSEDWELPSSSSWLGRHSQTSPKSWTVFFLL